MPVLGDPRHPQRLAPTVRTLDDEVLAVDPVHGAIDVGSAFQVIRTAFGMPEDPVPVTDHQLVRELERQPLLDVVGPGVIQRGEGHLADHSSNQVVIILRLDGDRHLPMPGAGSWERDRFMWILRQVLERRAGWRPHGNEWHHPSRGSVTRADVGGDEGDLLFRTARPLDRCRGCDLVFGGLTHRTSLLTSPGSGDLVLGGLGHRSPLLASEGRSIELLRVVGFGSWGGLTAQFQMYP